MIISIDWRLSITKYKDLPYTNICVYNKWINTVTAVSPPDTWVFSMSLIGGRKLTETHTQLSDNDLHSCLLIEQQREGAKILKTSFTLRNLLYSCSVKCEEGSQEILLSISNAVTHTHTAEEMTCWQQGNKAYIYRWQQAEWQVLFCLGYFFYTGGNAHANWINWDKVFPLCEHQQHIHNINKE